LKDPDIKIKTKTILLFEKERWQLYMDKLKIRGTASILKLFVTYSKEDS
jgi:hypothetical protein